jgi:hypothetical protein
MAIPPIVSVPFVILYIVAQQQQATAQITLASMLKQAVANGANVRSSLIDGSSIGAVVSSALGNAPAGFSNLIGEFQAFSDPAVAAGGIGGGLGIAGDAAPPPPPLGFDQNRATLDGANVSQLKILTFSDADQRLLQNAECLNHHVSSVQINMIGNASEDHISGINFELA